MNETHYAELWSFVATLLAVFALPLIEIYYRSEVSAQVIMSPIEKQKRVFAAAHDPALSTN
jgi:hypothetical protein